jgi:hypothetical protein
MPTSASIGLYQKPVDLHLVEELPEHEESLALVTCDQLNELISQIKSTLPGPIIDPNTIVYEVNTIKLRQSEIDTLINI